MYHVCYLYEFLKIILQVKQLLAYSARTNHFSNSCHKLRILLLKTIMQSVVINAVNEYLSHLSKGKFTVVL